MFILSKNRCFSTKNKIKTLNVFLIDFKTINLYNSYFHLLLFKFNSYSIINYVGSFRTFHSGDFSYSNNDFQDKLINRGQSSVKVGEKKFFFSTSKVFFSKTDEAREIEIKGELDKLKEKVDRLNYLRKEFFPLRLECHKSIEDFLSKYSRFKIKLGNFSSYLDKTLDKSTLINLLEKKRRYWVYHICFK